MKDSENIDRENDFSFKLNHNDSKPKVYESPQLFRGDKEIQINHEGELYRIRITRNGKLIMNK
jgi:hemin uptake protein HemP